MRSLLTHTTGYGKGGFTTAELAARNPVRLLESGPAAGVLSAINTANSAGVRRVLAFDMGGTTAKLCVAAEDRVHGRLAAAYIVAGTADADRGHQPNADTSTLAFKGIGQQPEGRNRDHGIAQALSGATNV